MNQHYYPGQRIVCRGEEWQIQKALSHKIANGKEAWEIEVTGLTGITRGQNFIFMSDLDFVEVVDPSNISPRVDTSAKAIQTRTFLEAHLRRLLPRNGAIYIGKHGAMEKTYPYQLKPASHALHQDRPRLLIADAVGLGKTIECGILLSELIRRGKGKRILAAVPKATLEQFQNEMWGRFAIPFHRLDSEGLEKLKQDLPSTMNPFFHFDKALISIDTLKLKKYQERLKNCDWDVLIIDEAHNVADRSTSSEGSLRHKVAKNLAQRAKAVVLMSATPHDGTKKGFASLIQLLDQTAIPNEELYTKDDVRPYFIRRTRTDVAEQIGNTKIRKQFIETIPLNEQEINVLQSLHDIEFKSKALKQRSQHGVRELFRTTLIKSFLSSSAALLETCEKKLKNLQASQAKDGAELEHDEENLKNIIVSITSAKLEQKTSRLDYLIKTIKNNPVDPTNKIVIFTERLATLKLIQEQLIKAGIVDGLYDPKAEAKKDKKNLNLVAIADGSMDEKKLMATVKSFQSVTGGVNILIATNVASEGLNLHENCHRLFHYDLPWSLITLEQRNGRIDRLGQKHTPHIYYLASQATAKTRESDLKQLKDDFWIVDKIQSRMTQAGQDLDEEALRQGLTSAENEDEVNSINYEEKTIGNETSKMDKILESMLSGTVDQPDEQFYTKPLPTLFKNSPFDFVKTSSEITKLKTEVNQTTMQIEVTPAMKTEISTWPKDLRPNFEKLNQIHLEHNQVLMEKHYRQSLNEQEKLDKTFMNEIHPLIQILEERAMELFPGKYIPTIKVDNVEPGSTYFLIQGSLFNKLNEYVFQTWELVEFKHGKSECSKMVDLYEPNHTQEIVNFTAGCLDNVSRAKEVTELESKRIQKLSQSAITWMKDQMKQARQKRKEDLAPELRNKLQAIKTWENKRREYLGSIVSGNGLANEVHGGVHAQKKQAEVEIEKLGQVSNEYQSFINNSIMTNEESDVRILAIFVSTMGKN